MTEKGGGKLHDIKETASDAVEIMRELGTPGVQETFDMISEIAAMSLSSEGQSIAPPVPGIHTPEIQVLQELSVHEAQELLRIEGTGLFVAAVKRPAARRPEYGPTFLEEAGGYPHNFTRDSIKFGLLANDDTALLEQVAFSAQNLGREINPFTGEEPGKAHHEKGHALQQLEVVEMNDRATTYNACDTSALLLIGVERLSRDGNEAVAAQFESTARGCAGYILRHTDEESRLFYEDPTYAGADRFALDVTYWKDSSMNHGEKEPKYPIVYTLAHFQNAASRPGNGHLKHVDSAFRDVHAGAVASPHIELRMA
jgi:hypothetical protein